MRIKLPKIKYMTYLRENYKQSSTRLIFVVGSFWAMAITSYLATNKDVDLVLLLVFYTGIQTSLIGLKLGQKSQESTLEIKKEELRSQEKT